MRLDTLHASRVQGLFDTVRGRFIGITAAVAAVDLLAKVVAVQSLGSTGVVPFSDRFSLFVVFNTGSAGGVQIGPYTWQLNVLVTLLAVGLIASVVQAMAAVDRRATRALAFVAGGAVGNLLSMLFGPDGVADFLAIRLTGETTIVANLADFALWTGAAMLAPVAWRLLRMVRAERAQRAAPLAVELS
ncbi:signal peptidase II [Gemmatimonas sp.]|uniref:signal peptidase II n=1 Tax=Gemmatimonas sp. TaxID=1962908 RepID=UPI003982EF43